MDTSLLLYWVFLLCGIAQIFTFATPMVVAAVIPFSAVVALFAGWFPVLGADVALYRSRVAAWIAILGAAPALLMALRAVVFHEFGYAAFFGIAPAIALAFAGRRIALGATLLGRPFRPEMSPATKRILAALPSGLFLVEMGRLVLR